MRATAALAAIPLEPVCVKWNNNNAHGPFCCRCKGPYDFYLNPHWPLYARSHISLANCETAAS